MRVVCAVLGCPRGQQKMNGRHSHSSIGELAPVRCRGGRCLQCRILPPSTGWRFCSSRLAAAASVVLLWQTPSDRDSSYNRACVFLRRDVGGEKDESRCRTQLSSNREPRSPAAPRRPCRRCETRGMFAHRLRSRRRRNPDFESCPVAVYENQSQCHLHCTLRCPQKRLACGTGSATSR